MYMRYEWTWCKYLIDVYKVIHNYCIDKKKRVLLKIARKKKEIINIAKQYAPCKKKNRFQ